MTIELVELRSRPISVLGAVTRPGDLAFSGQWTLLEAIAAAGGLADRHGEAIHVLRRPTTASPTRSPSAPTSCWR